MRTLVALALLCVVPSSMARGQNGTVACNGDIATVRLSQIKPTSSLPVFMKAMDAHRAWYRSHGFTNNEIFGARVIVVDAATKTEKYSDTEILTFHVRPPVVGKPDAAWDAYVRQYRDSADIQNEYRVCMPKNR